MKFSLPSLRSRAPIRATRVRPSRNAPVEVQIMGRDSLDIVNARDLSATGLGVRVPHGFEDCSFDNALDLVITLPGRRPFQARANLRHYQGRSNSYVGVEFTGLPERSKVLIEQYVIEQAERHPERSQVTRSF